MDCSQKNLSIVFLRVVHLLSFLEDNQDVVGVRGNQNLVIGHSDDDADDDGDNDGGGVDDDDDDDDGGDDE